MAGSTHNNKHKWTNWRRANFEFFKEKLGGLDADLKLLDIASGPEQFREVTWRFKEVVSIDFKQYGTTKIVADLTKGIPLADSTVDIVFLSNALEHFPDGRFMLRECSRVLRDGGFLIGTVPFMAPEHQGPYDYNRYTSYMLQLLFHEAGFQNVEITPLGTPAQVYINIINDFFRQLRKRKVSDGVLLQRVFFRTVGFVRLINLGLFALCRPLYNLAEANHQFTQGYGFTGLKQEEWINS